MCVEIFKTIWELKFMWCMGENSWYFNFRGISLFQWSPLHHVSKRGLRALSYYSDLMLSQSFQPMVAQLSKNAALPLAKILVTASCHNSKPGLNWPHSCMVVRPIIPDSKFMGPTWGPPGSCRPQMCPMLAPWTMLSGMALAAKPGPNFHILYNVSGDALMNCLLIGSDYGL